MYFCRSIHERHEFGYTKTLLRKQRTSVIFYSMDKNCLLYTSMCIRDRPIDYIAIVVCSLLIVFGYSQGLPYMFDTIKMLSLIHICCYVLTMHEVCEVSIRQEQSAKYAPFPLCRDSDVYKRQHIG